jgi:hypothetical protein
MEQGDVSFRRRCLGVIAARLEPRARLGGELRCSSGMTDFLGEEVGQERLGGRVRRIVDDETFGTEYTFQPSSSSPGVNSVCGRADASSSMAFVTEASSRTRATGCSFAPTGFPSATLTNDSSASSNPHPFTSSQS